MILTCPDCATSYFVDEERIPRRGRTVRCSNCGARWRATPDGEIAAEPEVAEPPPPEPAPVEEIESEPSPPPRPRPPPPPPPKRPPLGLIVGGAVGLALIALVSGAVVMRRQIASHMPGAAELFAAVGLPVDVRGLVIEDVTSRPAFDGVRPVLTVTGAIRNTRQKPAQAPPIHISLLDRKGAPLAGIVAQPLNDKVPAGSKRYFSISLPDPPAGAQQLEVRFDLVAKPAPHPPAAPALAQTGPAPIDAKPIPPTEAPDAAHPHE